MICGVGLLVVGLELAADSLEAGAALVISLVMLRSSVFNKGIAYLGIAASLFLLMGDFSAGIPPSETIAALFGIAYVLFIIWFLWIAQRLLQLGQNNKG